MKVTVEGQFTTTFETHPEFTGNLEHLKMAWYNAVLETILDVDTEAVHMIDIRAREVAE